VCTNVENARNASGRPVSGSPRRDGQRQRPAMPTPRRTAGTPANNGGPGLQWYLTDAWLENSVPLGQPFRRGRQVLLVGSRRSVLNNHLEPLLLDINSAAKFVGVGPETIRGWILEEQLPFVRAGRGGKKMFAPADLKSL
jgi:hypothetical protein